MITPEVSEVLTPQEEQEQWDKLRDKFAKEGADKLKEIPIAVDRSLLNDNPVYDFHETNE